MCTHDLRGKLLSINPWAARALGYEAKDLIGKNVRDILVPETRKFFQRYLRNIRKSGSTRGLMHLLTASGKVRIWEYHNTLRTEGLAEPIVRGIAYDISERTEAERALRQSESMYRELFDNSLDGVFRTTPDGRFVSANPALVSMLGYESENDLLSVKVQSLYLDPKARQRNIRMIHMAGEMRNLEIELRRKDGTKLIVLENAHAVRDPKGKVTLYEGALTDITERKQTEEALRTSEGELRALLDAIPDVILVLDHEGRYLKIASGNPNALYLPAEDLLGKRMHDLFSRPKADELLGHIRKALRTRKPVQFEYALLVGDGILWYSGAAAPFTKDTVVWAAVDITARKQVEEQVERRLLEQEALYESGLALSQTLDPAQIGRIIVKVLASRLNWHHATVRVRKGESDDVELLGFSQVDDQIDPASNGQELARSAITKVGQGMAGWVIKIWAHH